MMDLKGDLALISDTPRILLPRSDRAPTAPAASAKFSEKTYQGDLDPNTSNPNFKPQSLALPKANMKRSTVKRFGVCLKNPFSASM